MSVETEREPAYYDIPMLLPPLWRWEVASYFYLGGISASTYVLARLADRFGRDQYHDLTHAGLILGALTAAPCPPLLIHDLGDPWRFHHMMRIVKPKSPMNVGSWTLLIHSGIASLTAFRQWQHARRGYQAHPVGWEKVADETIRLASDVVGIPMALLLAGYTGVLLSATATPLWTKNPCLGALFSASAMRTGAAALRLSMLLGLGTDSPDESRAVGALDRVITACGIVEGATLAGYLCQARGLAAPLTRGRYAPLFWAGAVGCGMVAPEVVKRLPARGKAKRRLGILAPVLGLAGAFALRWALVYAGHTSAGDPAATRAAGRTGAREGASDRS